MQIAPPKRRSFPACRGLLVVPLLLATLGVHAALDIDRAEQRADHIKYSDNSTFLALLKDLDAQAASMTPPQRDWLAYLHAWQAGYSGDYPQAHAAFQSLIASTHDETIRARARVSLIFDQVNARQFEDAYTVMNDLLESLPRIDDPEAHSLVFDTAAYVYSRAGEFDLATSYTEQALASDSGNGPICTARETQLWILGETGKLRPDDNRIRAGLDACARADDMASANSITIEWAQAAYNHDDPAQAIRILKANESTILDTHSSALTAGFRALLATSYLQTGDLRRARQSALAAVAAANKQDHSRTVTDAFEVLYQVAKRSGDYGAALDYHEKRTAADKLYLNDISARALAFQTVHQRVLDKQRHIDAANDANKVLTLQRQVDAQKSRTRLLYIGLLLMAMAIVATWAYRTKRSQLKFQKLARRDGLTGIASRQHFLDCAQDALRACAKVSREASVLVMDLDHFKSVNDMHGHAAGDAALRRVVAACQARLRTHDLFGRLGGEEFAILLPDCAENAAAMRAEEMRADIASLPRFDVYADVLVTASFGVAGSRACGYNITALLAQADKALYRAKGAGRNRVVRHGARANAANT